MEYLHGKYGKQKGIDHLECKQKMVIQVIIKLNKWDSITFKFKENGIALF